MSASTPTSAPQTLRRARPWLGTLVDITLSGADAALLGDTMEACFATIGRMHGLMSFHDANSDVSRLNREAARRPVKVAAEVMRVLETAQAVSAQSSGLFDITVANRLVARGHLPQMPGGSSAPLDPAANWQDIALLPGNQVRFKRPLLIDLGGIAKGFAVDQAQQVCRQAGASLHGARINAGGDMARFGQADALVQIRHPLDGSQLVSIGSAPHCAIATSAYTHDHPVHIAPRNADATPTCASATVMASSCVIADALTKVVMLDEGGAIAAHCLDLYSASALVIDRQGNMHRSAIFAEASMVAANSRQIAYA